MALEILSLQTNIMQYSSYNEREIAIRETLYWVGLKYVLQTVDAIRYLCQQLQDILEGMEGYWKLIMVFLWQVDLVFPYPTQHFRHLNSIMYSLCVIQDFYLIAWDQTAPCHSDIIDTDNNYKNEFKNVFLKCTCVHNCAAVFTFSQSEVVGAVCLLPPLLSKKKNFKQEVKVTDCSDQPKTCTEYYEVYVTVNTARWRGTWLRQLKTNHN